MIQGNGRGPRPGMHPATADIDYAPDEWEFCRAVEAWKHDTGTRFPTLRQMFGVMRALGYEKATEEDPWAAVPLVRSECGPDGMVLRLSPWWATLTGQPLDEAVGLATFGRIHRHDRPGSQRAWLRSVAAVEPFSWHWRLVTADGTPRWHAARAWPILGPDGAPVRWRGVAVDVDALMTLGDLDERLFR